MQQKPVLTDESSQKLSCSNYMFEKSIVGKHCMLELYDCNSSKLNDELFIRTSLEAASKSARATLLNMITHRFQPQGVTGLALLAESHISIHTWPESRYAAIDIFTCGKETMPEKASEFFVKKFDAKSHKLVNFLRDSPFSLKDMQRDPLI